VLLALMLAACAGSGSAGRATTSISSGYTTGSTRPASGAETSTAADPGPPYEVRQLHLTFVDLTRPTVARPPEPASGSRILRTTVWMPAAGRGSWPLVVFGHGFGVSASTYYDLLATLASAGFVVAAPDFPGSSSALPGRADEQDIRQEPCDLLYVAGQLESASLAGQGIRAGAVRRGAVALGGQSDGATSAAFAALTDPAGTCGGPAVAAVVAFSARPVTVRPGADATVLAVTGTADPVNPPANTRALFSAAPAPAYLLTTAGDGHLAPSTTSPHRAAIDAVVVDLLRATLEHDSSARSRLAVDAARPGLTLDTR
jgi:dienelactone hydrolase